MTRLVPLLLLFAWSASAHAQDDGPRPAKPSNLTNYLLGDPEDSPNQPAGGPAFLVMGGSSEVTNGFRNQAYPIANGGDFVILRTSGGDGYQDYLYNMTGIPDHLKPNSVETLMIDSRDKADSDYVDWVIRTAEFVWMAGGNQSNYVNYWAGTRVQEAVQYAHDRGAVIGGTSAGMAMMGEWIFAPINTSAPSGTQSIANPYHSVNILQDRFVDSRLMDNIITDQHFAQRDRMGRPLSWMARLREEGRAESIIAVAADERASIFIDKDRIGHVLTGTSGRAVYIIWEDHLTERVQVESGQPLVYTNLRRARLTNGHTWDFNTMTGSRRPIRLSVDGAATPPFEPEDPYTPDQGPVETDPTPTTTPTPTPTESHIKDSFVFY